MPRVLNVHVACVPCHVYTWYHAMVHGMCTMPCTMAWYMAWYHAMYHVVYKTHYAPKSTDIIQYEQHTIYHTSLTAHIQDTMCDVEYNTNPHLMHPPPHSTLQGAPHNNPQNYAKGTCAQPPLPAVCACAWICIPRGAGAFLVGPCRELLRGLSHFQIHA